MKSWGWNWPKRILENGHKQKMGKMLGGIIVILIDGIGPSQPKRRDFILALALLAFPSFFSVLVYYTIGLFAILMLSIYYEMNEIFLIIFQINFFNKQEMAVAFNLD